MNNKQLFVDWYAWSLTYNDCDPAVWLTNYLHKRYEHNSEQKLWFCWLYGNTYQLPTSWVLLNEFPDYELATVSRITDWNEKNYKRLRYQTDTKWNKGHLPSMFESYQKFAGDFQQTKFESLYGDNEKQNFDNIWNSVKSNLHKFGRYSTWFYLQHLKHTAGIKINPTSLMLNDYEGSRSHRNGLLLALDKSNLVDSRLTNAEYADMEAESFEIMEETRLKYPNIAHLVDAFTMETCLCSFKKIFRTREGRYLGYYLDRQAEEIQQAEKDGWFGIDWNVLWQARKETLDFRLNRKIGIEKENFTFYSKYGRIQNIEWLSGNQYKTFTLEDFF